MIFYGIFEDFHKTFFDLGLNLKGSNFESEIIECEPGSCKAQLYLTGI